MSATPATPVLLTEALPADQWSVIGFSTISEPR